MGPRTAEQELLLLLLGRVEQLEAGHDSSQARLALLPSFDKPVSVSSHTTPLSFKVTAYVWEDAWDSRGRIEFDNNSAPEPPVALLKLLDSQLDGRTRPYYAFHSIYHTLDFSNDDRELIRMSEMLPAEELAQLLEAFDNPLRKIRCVSH